MTHLDDGADLRAVMDRTIGGLDAPDHVGPAAVATGRRIRSRRRVTIALTGVAAVAAVTALTLPALGGSGTANDATFASDPTPTPTFSPTPTPTTLPETAAGWWSMPSSQMLQHLEQVLPDGVRVETSDADTEVETFDGERVANTGSLNGILSAGTGPGTFQLLLYPPSSEDGGLYVTTDAEGNESHVMLPDGLPLTERLKCVRHYDTCLRIRDTSGEQIGRVSSDVESGTTLYEAFLLGPDGGGLNFTVMDSSGDKPGYEAPSADVPPLSLDQLRTLAEDPAWTSYTP